MAAMITTTASKRTAHGSLSLDAARLRAAARNRAEHPEIRTRASTNLWSWSGVAFWYLLALMGSWSVFTH